jgi:hypothetical protein
MQYLTLESSDFLEIIGEVNFNRKKYDDAKDLFEGSIFSKL